MKISYEAFFYTHDELQVLAAVSGASRLYGFASEAKGRKEALQAVYNLARRGILTGGETGYSFSDDSAALVISDMIKAVRMIKVYPKEESLPVKCCYVREKRLVCCEVYPLTKDMVKVYSIKTNELYEMLMDEGYFPAARHAAEGSPGPFLPDMPLCNDAVFKPAEELLRDTPVYLLADKLSADTGEIEARLAICDGIFGKVIMMNEGQDWHQAYCMPDTMKKNLLWLLEES